MKIAFFTDTYFPQLNGVTISVASFAKELRKQGHTVYIFAPKIKKYADRNKDVYRLPAVHVLRSVPEFQFPIGISLKGLFKVLRMDFDIVHAHGNGPFSLLGMQVAKNQGIPYVLTFHTMLTEYTHYFLKGKVITPGIAAAVLRIIANRCDGIIAPSEKMKEKLFSYGCKKEIVVIPNFVEADSFQDKRKGHLHKKLRLAKDVPFILSVGRLAKEKNFAFLIEMFAELTKKDTTSHLVIVGQGPEKQALEALIKKLDMTKRIHLTGRISSEHMPEVYADATLFVFTSTSEVHPMVVLEAAAAGLPLVVANDLAFAQVVVEGKNGYLVPLSIERFVEKIEKILQNSEIAKKYGIASEEIVQENFSGQQVTEKLVLFYEEKIAKNRTRHKTILSRVNKVAAKGVRGIRKTRTILHKAVFGVTRP